MRGRGEESAASSALHHSSPPIRTSFRSNGRDTYDFDSLRGLEDLREWNRMSHGARERSSSRIHVPACHRKRRVPARGDGVSWRQKRSKEISPASQTCSRRGVDVSGRRVITAAIHARASMSGLNWTTQELRERREGNAEEKRYSSSALFFS